jgi:outer membrane protein assembly factor BamB
MRDWLTSHGEFRRRAQVLLLTWSLASVDAGAQQFPFRTGSEARTELPSAQVDLISGTTAARIEQAQALSADKNWDEAVDILRDVAGEDTKRVVDLGGGRLVTLREYCHMQLAALPAEALAVYRNRVDPQTERWYRDGVASHDEELLARVVHDSFCSRWGDDALLALGELALERADYDGARRFWEQISPLLRDPMGRPMWLVLRDIDVNAHWAQIERRWFARPRRPTWLAYPDTDLDLAEVRARLILVSIRAGELNRAQLELSVFRRLHLDATGSLGGQEGSYVEALERLIVAANQWPAERQESQWATFAGSSTRLSTAPKLGPVTGPTWLEPVTFSMEAVPRNQRQIQLGRGPVLWVEPGLPSPTRDAQRPLSCFPVVWNGLVLFNDGQQIRAVDLAAGEPSMTSARAHSVDESFDARGTIAHGVPRHTLTVIDGVVYGRIGQVATTRLEVPGNTSGDRLVGLDLNREGVLVFRVRPDDASWSFDGVPVSDGHRLFVAMRQGDVTPRAYVACFDATSGSQLWRTSIGTAETPAGGRGDEITHNLLTLAGDRIYFNTNFGLVAALDTYDGKVCWLHRYDRHASQPFGGSLPGPLHFHRDPAPCLFYNGLLIVAPADTPKIFALDSSTGHTAWTTDALPDALHVLGVVRRNLIVGGNRLAALDVLSGKMKFVWPESEQAGIRGMGRGVVAGDEVFWPTRNEIYVIHAMTGGQSRNPIQLASISDSGANLAAAQGRLIAAGPDKLMAFGPAIPIPPKRTTATNQPLATSD